VRVLNSLAISSGYPASHRAMGGSGAEPGLWRYAGADSGRVVATAIGAE
jgi:hypothetical protein